jgi:hypothetical protein
MTTNAMTFGPVLLTIKLPFIQLPSENWHGLAPIGHQKPVSHCSITYQTHMENIQGSGGS